MSPTRSAIWILGLALSSVAVVASCREKASSGHSGRKVLYYVDTMHPQYKSDKPGIAPDCGMPLSPVYADEARKPAAAPAARPGASGRAAERRVLYWYDPMSPGSHFDKPGKSPFMDMQLVPRYAEEEKGGGGAGAASAVNLSPDALRAAGVATAPVLRGDLVHETRAVGTVAADETRLVHVAARVGGRVERLYANYTGEAVRRGAPLYDLYSPELVATQREYLLALENRERLAGAGGDAAASAESLLGATRDRLRLWGVGAAAVRALQRSKKADLALTFTSPISGTVLQKSVVAGQYVQEGTDLYLLADFSNVWLVAQVYEADLGTLRVGLAATVQVNTYPGRPFAGRIAFIEPVIDRETRTGRVRIELSNPRGELKPGMFGNAILRVPLGHTLSVLKSAVIDTGTRQIVYVETAPGSFTPREVKVGSTAGDRVQIREGLSERENVVAAASFLLDSQAQLSGGSAVQWSGAKSVPVPVEARPGSRQ